MHCFQLFTLLTLASAALVSAARGPVWNRLDKDNAVLLIVDHQVGLFHVARDFTPTEVRNNIIAHAKLGKIFNLPTVLTTSAETGPNGPLPKEILQMYKGQKIIQRNGEVNAWDNAEFRVAVKATGKKQVIIAGITTEVCTAFLALSLRQEGFEVFANADASGTFDARTADLANNQMRAAGVQVYSFFAIAMDLMRDWRNTPGVNQLLPFLDEYLPAYGYVARAHAAAVLNGTVGEVHEDLVTVE